MKVKYIQTINQYRNLLGSYLIINQFLSLLGHNIKQTKRFGPFLKKKKKNVRETQAGFSKFYPC